MKQYFRRFLFVTLLASIAVLTGALLPIGPQRAVLLSSSLDHDAQSWRNAVAANGGTVTSARLASVAALIRGLKASGAWANADDYWVLVADSSTQALTSLKQRRLATAVNSPTFAANAGFTFDGATNYINTNFTPNVNGAAMNANSIRLAVYERQNISSTGLYGLNDTSSRTLRMEPRNGSSMIAGANSATGTYTLGVADSRGYNVVSRNGTGSGNVGAYKNGVALSVSSAPPSVGATLPTISAYVGAQNNGGTAAGFRMGTVGLIALGASLSAAQEAAEYATVQAYMTTWGAGV